MTWVGNQHGIQFNVDQIPKDWSYWLYAWIQLWYGVGDRDRPNLWVSAKVIR